MTTRLSSCYFLGWCLQHPFIALPWNLQEFLSLFIKIHVHRTAGVIFKPGVTIRNIPRAHLSPSVHTRIYRRDITAAWWCFNANYQPNWTDFIHILNFIEGVQPLSKIFHHIFRNRRLWGIEWMIGSPVIASLPYQWSMTLLYVFKKPNFFPERPWNYIAGTFIAFKSCF